MPESSNVDGSPISLRGVLKKIGDLCWWKKVVLAALGIVLIAVPLWQVLMLGSSSAFLCLSCIGAAIEIVLVVASCLKDKGGVDGSPENKKIVTAHEKFLELPFSMKTLISTEGLAALQKEAKEVDSKTNVEAFVGKEGFEQFKKLARSKDEISDNLTFADIGNTKKFEEKKPLLGVGCNNLKFNAIGDAIRFIIALSYIPHRCFALNPGDSDVCILELPMKKIHEFFNTGKMVILNENTETNTKGQFSNTPCIYRVADGATQFLNFKDTEAI